jgi:hypothetical protein
MSLGLGLSLTLSSRYGGGAPPTEVPANIAPPAINEATLAVGDNPTWTNGTWANGPILSRTHELYADAVLIAGGPYTSGEYELTEDEIGADITVGEVATNVIGDSDEEFSAAVGPVGDGSAYPIVTPDLTDPDTEPNVAGDLRPSYRIVFNGEAPEAGGIGDTVQMQWGISEGAASGMTPEEAVAAESWWISNVDPFPALGDFAEVQSVAAVISYRIRIKRSDGLGGWLYSDWSAYKTLTIADGSITAPGLSDLTGQATSTRVWSAPFTAEIADPTALARLIGTGPIEVDDGGGADEFEAGEYVLVADGDEVRFGVDTSGAAGTEIDNVVTNRGAAVETFSATTAGVSLPQSASIDLLLEAAPANLKQLVTNATDVTTDGDVVGYWADVSGNGFDFSATANDGTRPLYKTSGGLHWVEFDGTNDMLRRLAVLDLYNTGSYTFAVALRMAASANRSVFGEVANGTSPIITPLGSDATTGDDAVANYRNNAATQILPTTTDSYVGAFDGNDAVFVITDDGSTLKTYKDGVSGTDRAYTRSGTVTPTRTSLGALMRATTINYFPGRIYGVAIWPGVVLDSTEIDEATTYLGVLQGRSI